MAVVRADKGFLGCYLIIAVPFIILLGYTIYSVIREKSGIDDVPQKVEINKLNELDTRNTVPVIIEGYITERKEDYKTKHYLMTKIGDTATGNQAELCESSLYDFSSNIPDIIKKQQRVRITGRYGYYKCVHVNKIEDAATNTVIGERK